MLPPLGVYDPLGLIETRDMRRYEIMEIKHVTQLSASLLSVAARIAHARHFESRL